MNKETAEDEVYPKDLLQTTMEKQSVIEEAYQLLCAYTLMRGDAEFIHQYVVDAYAAQNAGNDTKPITFTFALVGLYLLVEKRWTGRQIQRAHMDLARRKNSLHWPALDLPANRGLITPIDVIAAPEGSERDQAIYHWCKSVWESFIINRDTIEEFLKFHLIL